MHRILILTAALSLFVTAHLPAAEPVRGLSTDTFALRYLSAVEAKNRLEKENLGAVVKATDVETNTVVLDAAHDRLSDARMLLVTLDQEPQRVLCSVVISQVDAVTGEEKVVSKPTLFTLSGKEAVVTYPLGKDKTLKFQVTPRVVK